jgi:hypothetical protein
MLIHFLSALNQFMRKKARAGAIAQPKAALSDMPPGSTLQGIG